MATGYTQKTSPVTVDQKFKASLAPQKPVTNYATPAQPVQPAQSGYATPESTYDPTPRRYSGNSFIGGGGSSRKGPTGSSVDGVSAVNPRSDMDVQGYVDQTYDALMGRMEPQFERQGDAFQQMMINRGIPVGGEAYGEGYSDLMQTQNDARTQAGLQALGFGADLQNQNFQQDATRSSLANSLLQAKWGNELGWGNLGLGYAGLDERGRQFDQNLGYNYDALGQRGYEFDALRDDRAYEFDSNMDYNYWDRGSQYDWLYDQADRSDMRWLNEFDRQLTNDQINNERWADTYGSNFINPFIPQTPNVGAAFVGAQNANNQGANYQNQASNDWWNNLGQTVGRGVDIYNDWKAGG